MTKLRRESRRENESACFHVIASEATKQASFLRVARMERQRNPGRLSKADGPTPDCASLHPGYAGIDGLLPPTLPELRRTPSPA